MVLKVATPRAISPELFWVKPFLISRLARVVTEVDNHLASLLIVMAPIKTHALLFDSQIYPLPLAVVLPVTLSAPAAFFLKVPFVTNRLPAMVAVPTTDVSLELCSKSPPNIIRVSEVTAVEVKVPVPETKTRPENVVVPLLLLSITEPVILVSPPTEKSAAPIVNAPSTLRLPVRATVTFAVIVFVIVTVTVTPLPG